MAGKKFRMGKAFLAFLICSFGFTAFGGNFSPLREPDWSPILILAGKIMQPSVDTVNAVLIADLDGDGIPEVILGGDYLHQYYIEEGRPVRSYLFVYLDYMERTKWAGPGGEALGVRALAAADVDRDGLVDLVVAGKDGIWIFGNRGRWGFEAYPGSPYPMVLDHLWLHDFNEDGILDVLGAKGTEVLCLRGWARGRRLSEEVLTIEGTRGRIRAGSPGAFRGDSGFFILTESGLWFLPNNATEAREALGGRWLDLGVTDFDGNGFTDLALSDGLKVDIYFGSSGGFEGPLELRVEAGHYAQKVLVADPNGDGLPDLIVGSGSPAGFSLFYNLGGRNFLPPIWHGVQDPAMPGLPATFGGIAAGDLNNDGKDDVVVLTNFHVAFLLTQGTGRTLQSIPGSFLLGVADLNGDGFMDLLSSTAEGGVAGLLSTGYGGFQTTTLAPGRKDFTPYIARFGDVDGDGKEELVVYELAEEWMYIPERGKPLWEWKKEKSKARISVWEIGGKEPLWSALTGERVLPLLFLFDLDGDGIAEPVTAVGQVILGFKWDPHAGDPWERIKRVEIPAGGEIGPMTSLKLRSGEVLAGLRLGERSELFLLRAGKVEETGIKLEIAPLDLVSADINGDGNEDLILVGWGVMVEADLPKLVVQLDLLFGDGEGNFGVQVTSVPEWPPLCLPFPYGGLAAGDLDGDGDPDIAIMRMPDKEGNPGGIVIFPWEGKKLGRMEFLKSCAGIKLFALDVDGDGKAELCTVQLGIPAQLCVLKWR
jgi:hypothetical protein